MIRFICAIDFAGASTLPSSTAACSFAACARKLTFGFASKIFCQPAVSVQIRSHTVGTIVTTHSARASS